MKNYIAVILSLLLISQAYGLVGRKTIPGYVIHSDEKDSTVLNGFCTIEGQVLDGGVPVPNVNIQSFKFAVSTVTDSQGNFQIRVDTAENGIYTNHNDFLPTYLEDYEFKSGHKIKMHFNLKKPEAYNVIHQAVKKPVIYAYGDAGTSFEISIKTAANITFTYPELNEKWQMTISENGLLKDPNDNQYPYLFWEGEMTNLDFQKSEEKIIGSIVSKSNTVAFLEEKLTQLGFNASEKTDFITFWAPLIQKHKASFVQFLIDDDYEIISTMDIIPKPNNIRRVYLLFSDAKEIDDTFIDTNLDFKSFDRNGFTILEWGGTEIVHRKKL